MSAGHEMEGESDVNDGPDLFEEGPGEPLSSELEHVLEGARPLPSPSFRGALARLVATTPLPRAVRHWRAKAVALAIAGAALLALAGAGVAGKGPLAPSHAAASTSSASH